MRTSLKLPVLCITASLILASCGGPSTPDKGTKPVEPTPDATTPVQGGTIARPADSTAANEFIITGVRAKQLAASLGVDVGTAQNVMARAGTLQAQATTDEMRVLLAVTRSKSGDNAGKKRAVATFVWGNDQEQVVAIKDTKSVTLDIYPESAPNMFQRYEGNLDMKVTYPDFQAKTTRSGTYVTDTGKMCAKLSFNFTTKENAETPSAGYSPLGFNNSAAPLEVCEGVTERNAEKVALEKAADNLLFTQGSIAAAPFSFVSKDGVTALPTDAAGLSAAVGTDASATVTTQTLADFFAPLVVLPAGDSKTWTTEQKEQASVARKYIALQKQFGYYYRSATVYTVATSAGRDDIVILGLNGWGVGGLKTFRFK